jgi:acetylornithine deacetylase/succinyl-diaminopimelate desuccinylase-like protein
MKGELAARVVAFAEIARSGERPAGDVVLVAESDEERNTYDVGMSWLVRERPDVRCDYALNEGGGMLLELAGGRRVVTISIGEKQVASLRLRLHGRAGHASVPAGADNVLRRAAEAVQRLLDYEAPERLTPPIAAALDGLGAPVDAGAGKAIAWAAAQHPVLAGMFPAMTRMTVTPTGLQTHEPANVIPPFTDVICDCRALPGQTLDDVRDHVERALGGLEHDLELLEPLAGGTESPTGTPLYRICEEHVRERLPGAELLPVVTPGFTDSHWVRDAHGTVAYGFAPVFTTPLDVYLDGAHGADEAIDVADLAEMTAFNLRAIRSLR